VPFRSEPGWRSANLPAATVAVRGTGGTRKTQPRLAARRGNGTRHDRMVGRASAGSEPADGSILRGTAFMESGVPWAVPITSNASAETTSRTAHRILRRLDRVLRGRAVRRGSAYSASRSLGAPSVWSRSR